MRETEAAVHCSLLMGALWVIFIFAFPTKSLECVFILLPEHYSCSSKLYMSHSLTRYIAPTMYIKLLHSQTSTMIFYCYLPYGNKAKRERERESQEEMDVIEGNQNLLLLFFILTPASSHSYECDGCIYVSIHLWI